MEKLIEEWQNHNNFHRFEGESGVERLNKLTNAIGYKEDGFRFGSSLERFLCDNSGAIDAIIEWIVEQDLPEWKEELLTYLEENDEN